MVARTGRSRMPESSTPTWARRRSDHPSANMIRRLIEASSMKSTLSASNDTDPIRRAVTNSTPKYARFSTATNRTARERPLSASSSRLAGGTAPSHPTPRSSSGLPSAVQRRSDASQLSGSAGSTAAALPLFDESTPCPSCPGGTAEPRVAFADGDRRIVNSRSATALRTAYHPDEYRQGGLPHR